MLRCSSFWALLHVAATHEDAHLKRLARAVLSFALRQAPVPRHYSGGHRHVAPPHQRMAPTTPATDMEQSLLSGAADPVDEIEVAASGQRRMCGGAMRESMGATDSLSNMSDAGPARAGQGSGFGSSSSVRVIDEDDAFWLSTGSKLRRWLPQICAATLLAWPIVLPSLAATPLLGASLFLVSIRIFPRDVGAPLAAPLASNIIVGKHRSGRCVRACKHRPRPDTTRVHDAGLAGLLSLMVLLQLAFEVDAMASLDCRGDGGGGRRHRGRADGGQILRQDVSAEGGWKELLGLAPFASACGLSGAVRQPARPAACLLALSLQMTWLRVQLCRRRPRALMAAVRGGTAARIAAAHPSPDLPAWTALDPPSQEFLRLVFSGSSWPKRRLGSNQRCSGSQRGQTDGGAGSECGGD